MKANCVREEQSSSWLLEPHLDEDGLVLGWAGHEQLPEVGTAGRQHLEICEGKQGN